MRTVSLISIIKQVSFFAVANLHLNWFCLSTAAHSIVDSTSPSIVVFMK